MPIETDIKQTQFQSAQHRLVVNLMFTNNWLCEQQARCLKPFGITLQQYNVLRILRGHHPQPMRVNTIAERMLDRMSNASRLVDKLLAKGLVERTECPLDRRAVDVVITDAGLALLKETDARLNEVQERLRILSDDEATHLSHLLDRMRGSE